MARGPDPIYTPAATAMRVAAAMPATLCGGVFDPSAGEGALLRAVADRFGERVRPIGVDIEVGAVRALAREAGWVVGRADSLSARSRRSCGGWRAAQDDLGAVVLNPPFSCRGNGGRIVRFNGFAGRVAPAIEFLSVVLEELAPREGYWAILPAGAVQAERHIDFWHAVRERHEVSVLDDLHPTTFPGARVSASLVHLGPGGRVAASAPSPVSSVVPERPARCVCVEVVRGRVPVFRIDESYAGETSPFVHTTDLGVAARHPGARRAPSRLSDTTPLVLIGRVGRWVTPARLDVGKVVLSDCLIGLRPLAHASLEPLLASISASRIAFEAEYRGTGAQYLTLSGVSRVLASLGWRPTVVRASQPVGSCSCIDEGHQEPLVAAGTESSL